MMSSPDNSAWQRREVTVEHENTKMQLKLWVEQSNLVDDNFLGQNALIKNIVIDRFKGSNTLASRDQTTIEVCLLFSCFKRKYRYSYVNNCFLLV